MKLWVVLTLLCGFVNVAATALNRRHEHPNRRRNANHAIKGRDFLSTYKSLQERPGHRVNDVASGTPPRQSKTTKDQTIDLNHRRDLSGRVSGKLEKRRHQSEQKKRGATPEGRLCDGRRGERDEQTRHCAVKRHARELSRKRETTDVKSAARPENQVKRPAESSPRSESQSCRQEAAGDCVRVSRGCSGADGQASGDKKSPLAKRKQADCFGSLPDIVELPCGNPCGGPCGIPCGSSCGSPCGSPCGRPCGSSCGSPCGGPCCSPCGSSCGSPCGSPCGSSCGSPCGGLVLCPEGPITQLGNCPFPMFIKDYNYHLPCGCGGCGAPPKPCDCNRPIIFEEVSTCNPCGLGDVAFDEEESSTVSSADKTNEVQGSWEVVKMSSELQERDKDTSKQDTESTVELSAAERPATDGAFTGHMHNGEADYVLDSLETEEDNSKRSLFQSNPAKTKKVASGERAKVTDNFAAQKRKIQQKFDKQFDELSHGDSTETTLHKIASKLHCDRNSERSQDKPNGESAFANSAKHPHESPEDVEQRIYKAVMQKLQKCTYKVDLDNRKLLIEDTAFQPNTKRNEAVTSPVKYVTAHDTIDGGRHFLGQKSSLNQPLDPAEHKAGPKTDGSSRKLKQQDALKSGFKDRSTIVLNADEEGKALKEAISARSDFLLDINNIAALEKQVERAKLKAKTNLLRAEAAETKLTANDRKVFEAREKIHAFDTKQFRHYAGGIKNYKADAVHGDNNVQASPLHKNTNPNVSERQTKELYKQKTDRKVGVSQEYAKPSTK